MCFVPKPLVLVPVPAIVLGSRALGQNKQGYGRDSQNK